MKRMMVWAFALALMLSLGAIAFAQENTSGGSTSNDNMSSDQKSDMSKDTDKKDTDKKPPLKWVKGTIQTADGKTWLVADKDQKKWEIVNPEAVEGHDGHHVKVQAHIYADKDQIHVMKVEMVKAKGEKKKSDSMSDMK
jgi:pentapeptide MXKDX repeat protein